MNDTRPFQFGIKHVLGITVFVAAVAWLVRDNGPIWFQVVAGTYISVGCAQIVTALSLMTRSKCMGIPREHHREYQHACGQAYVNLILTMPSWLMLVKNLYSPSLHGASAAQDLLSAVCFLLSLHALALFTNGMSWIVYFRPLPERFLMLLRLLNLINSVMVFGFICVAVLLMNPR
jgi:hypothetical protein